MNKVNFTSVRSVITEAGEEEAQVTVGANLVLQIHTSASGQGVDRGAIHIWVSSYYGEGA